MKLDHHLGFEVGEDLEKLGFGERVGNRLTGLADAHEKVAKDFSLEAQYMVAFGALRRFRFKTNLREIIYMTELRSGSGAHKAYAQVASEMAKQVIETYPALRPAFQHVK